MLFSFKQKLKNQKDLFSLFACLLHSSFIYHNKTSKTQKYFYFAYKSEKGVAEVHMMLLTVLFLILSP
jgi:hypothetical protein